MRRQGATCSSDDAPISAAHQTQLRRLLHSRSTELLGETLQELRRRETSRPVVLEEIAPAVR